MSKARSTMYRKPLVSIIVPVYNVQDYLRECIQSLIFQTYQNIEIIAIDDASTDSSYEILKEYESEKVRVFKHTKNRGQSAGRNLGIKESNGEILLFVDSDDSIETETVQTIVTHMTKYDVGLVRFNAKSYDEKTKKIFIEKKYNFSQYLRENYIYKNRQLKDIYLSYTASPVLYAFKKRILMNNHIKFTKDIIHEDELFNTELYLNIQSALFINQSFYIRRYRDNSTMTNKSKDQLKYSFDSYIYIMKNYNALLENIGNDNQKLFIKSRINSIVYNLRKFEIDDNYKNDKLAEMNNRKLYYKKIYKNKIRFLKIILIVKNKIMKSINFKS